MSKKNDPGNVTTKPRPSGNESSADLVLVSDVLPDLIPIMPVRMRPYFPGFMAPVTVSGDHLDKMQGLLEGPDQTVGLVLVKDPAAEDSPENLHHVGVGARVVKAVQTEVESAYVLLNCVARFTIQELKETKKGWNALVKYHHETELSHDEELKAYALAIVATLKELVQLDPLQSEAIKLFLSHSAMQDPGRLADFSASLTTASSEELQEVLATFNVRSRIDKALLLLRQELEMAKLKQKITDQIEEQMSERQREFFLREQLKAIKQELGIEKEGKASEIETFQERLREISPSTEAVRVIAEEMEKLSYLEPASPEYTVTRNYLDWLTILPWQKLSKDSYRLARARRILDRDHYGLEDVKDRIIEFIAVGKMKGDISGSILCLVGPPGVGKTSIGRSIGEALGRRFYRFSLGGMRDEAEIKGHRRTYIGSMPGKFLQALKTAGTANPVIMLDEIDKIGASFRGDPASALLEVLDPEQNSSFRDHYLDVPFDLSNVLFISTANQIDTIPLALLDRMETIRLSGYIPDEKVEIARRHLIPRALKGHGLARTQVRFTPAALRKIIDGYARDAGVRGLEKKIKKVLRKSAIDLAKDSTRRVVVKKGNITEFLGEPDFKGDERLTSGPGVVTGLAWTSLGGVTLQVEATAVLTKQHGFKQTGQLGQVMVESSEIAYSYVMSHLKDYGAREDFFQEHFVHLHVPAGATPKDGPSAGVTMATALISMVRDQAVVSRLAMTGELTLTGRVLSIGGLKEKVIAARRAGCKTLIFPDENRGDFERLPDYLKKGFKVYFAGHFPDVYRIAFGG